jgi:hypothetical protein
MGERSACVARMAVGVVCAFPAAALGLVSHGSLRTLVPLAMAFPIALVLAVPAGLLAGRAYRGSRPSAPTPAMGLWLAPRLFWQGPVLGTLGLAALAIRCVAMLSPRLARAASVTSRWEPGELGRTWVGLPIWALFLGAPLRGRRESIEWDHALMHRLMQRYFPFAVIVVASMIVNMRHPIAFAFLAAASLGDFLVLEYYAREWAQKE